MPGTRTIAASLGLVAVGIAASLGSAASASAVTIDDFGEPQASSTLSGVPPQSSTVFGVDGPGPGTILGGHRQSDLSFLAGSPSDTVSASVASSRLVYASTANGVGSIRLTYDGNNTPGISPAGLGAVNLPAAAPSLEVVAQADLPVRLGIRVYSGSLTQFSDVTDAASGPVAEGIELGGSAGLQAYSIPLSYFRTGDPSASNHGPNGPANLASVGAVVIETDPVPALDLILDEIRTPPLPVLPAPTAVKLNPSLAFDSKRAGLTTLLTKLQVAGLEPGVSVAVVCASDRKPNGCPFKRKEFTPAGASLALTPNFKGRNLARGTLVSIDVTRAGATGRRFSLLIRTGKPPKSSTLCLPPGGPKPVKC